VGYVGGVERLVVVPASAVADVVDLVERAIPDLDPWLAAALTGSVSQLVSVGVLEPVLEPA
jgi:hypothetical protein